MPQPEASVITTKILFMAAGRQAVPTSGVEKSVLTTTCEDVFYKAFIYSTGSQKAGL